MNALEIHALYNECGIIVVSRKSDVFFLDITHTLYMNERHCNLSTRTIVQVGDCELHNL